MSGIALIKELRSITNAPLGDCKKALSETNGDLEQAKQWLKERGILKAGKKSDRETNEGVVKFLVQGSVVVGVKVLCETDFVAKNKEFHNLVDTLLDNVVAANGTIVMDDVPVDLAQSLQTMLDENVAKIGESLRLAGVYRKELIGDVKALVYNHTGYKIATVIEYRDGSQDFAKLIALQVTAMNPTYISLKDIPADLFDQAKQKYLAELADSNKPDNIKEKIVEGKLYKTFKDDVLLEQESIKDSTKMIKDIIGDTKVLNIYRVTIG